MRGLKVLVTIMTLMIVVGLGMLAYGIANLSHKKTLVQAESVLNLPGNGRVTQMTQWKDGLALYVTSGSGDAIYFVNPEEPEKTTHLNIAKVTSAAR